MKTKMIPRRIHANRSGDPGEVLRLIQAADAITLSDHLHCIGFDIVETVNANTPELGRPGMIAAYLFRIALILHREGRLVEATLTPEK